MASSAAAQTADDVDLDLGLDLDVGSSDDGLRPLEQHPGITPGQRKTAAAVRLPTTEAANGAEAGGTTPPQHSSGFLHEHRAYHTPSKLPTFRFGDRLLQNKPRPGHPSLVVSPGPPAGPARVSSTSLLVETAHHQRPQNTTVNPENSCPRPQTLQASALPAPPPPPLLTPVTEADEYQSTDAGDPDPVSRRDHRWHDNTSADSPHSITSPDERSPRSRASTYQTASTSAPITPNTAKPSGSIRIDDTTVATPTHNPSSPAAPTSQTDTDSLGFYTPATHPRTRRATSTRDGTSASSPLASRGAKDTRSPGTATKEWAHGQRGLILPQVVNGTLSDEADKIPRRRSSTTRPPLSYRPPPPGIATPGRIPPIRSFRSSGSRNNSVHSLPDMNHSSYRYHDEGDDYRDSSERDRSLRALEGRRSNDWSREAAPPDADDEITESENNTADIFMRIAREDSSSSIPRRNTDRGDEEEQNGTVSRVVRTARASRPRPASGVYNTSSFQRPPTPPSVSRRLSDHQAPVSQTIRRVVEDQPEQLVHRDAPYQSSVIGRPSLKLDSTRASSRVATLKPSPITPRTQSVLDYPTDRNSIVARRPPSKAGHGRSRSSSLRQPTSLSKSFNPSPLAPKTGEAQHTAGGQHEASESSNSTAAPSTVWDELDELKSRIHRLELTGKMPKTSGAAISRTSDERPPTAGTGATTISGSPKRAQTEVISTTSSQKEAQPILRSALAKTRPFVGPDVYDAIEAATNDALSLSLLMGTVGQPGPISSGASTIGVGGSSTVTDRQLRKKADSICRSLTELCLALTEEKSQRRTASTSRPQTRGTSTTRDDEQTSSPPHTMRVFTGRQSAGPDEPLSSIEPLSSPRATRLEKRATFNFTGASGVSNVPSPRYASSVVGGDDTITGRKSSLVISRARRGVTEEPDDQGRKTSLLRTRRANTEEPEEDEGSHSRKSSLALPPRRVTTISRVSNIDEESQAGSRAPSRAITELGNGLRIAVPPRDSIARRPLAQEPASASSIQGPRRLLMSGLPTPGPYSSRLMTPTTPSARRFLQVTRQQQERDDTGDMTGRLAEDRGQRYSMGAPSSASIARGPSLHRKRHSGIPNISGTASNVGGYR